MKKLAMLLMLFSVSVFNLGCEEAADDPVDTPPATDTDPVDPADPAVEEEGEVPGAG